MSSVVTSLRDRLSAGAAQSYLGPAEVLDPGPGPLEVRLLGGAVVKARMALAHPYDAQPGDEVLIIGNEGGHYVIGVLSGAGRSTLAFQGNVDISANGGVLRLSSDKGVEVDAPNVEVRASTLQMLAGAVAQRFASLRQTVTALVSLRAGQTHTVVDGSTYAQSKRATILTEGKVTINGKEIYLG
jgi:hypothetical protein